MYSLTTDSDAAQRAQKVYDYLKQLGIYYETVSHAPIFTSNDEVEAFRGIEVLDIKNLFLKGHKGKRHYLIVMPYDKPLDMRVLAERIGEKSLSFASEERLSVYLGTDSGAVSIFGLLNDTGHEVDVILDTSVIEAQRVGFHPNISTETLIISQDDFRHYLKSLMNRIRFISI